MRTMVVYELFVAVVDRLLPAPIRSSGTVLILANLMPLYGVFAWDWPVFNIMVLYWAENVLAGIYTVLRLIVTSPGMGSMTAGFFCMHYGAFCAGHGFFVNALFNTGPARHGGVEALVLTIVQMPDLLLAVVLLAFSHGWSFAAYASDRPRDPAPKLLGSIMMRPYRRMVLLHVGIIAGGFAIIGLSSPELALTPLILFKTGVDVVLHRRANVRALEIIIPPAVPPTSSSTAPLERRPRPYEIP